MIRAGYRSTRKRSDHRRRKAIIYTQNVDMIVLNDGEMMIEKRLYALIVINETSVEIHRSPLIN